MKEVTDHIIAWEIEIIRNFILFLTKITYEEEKFNTEAVANRSSQSFNDSLAEFDEVNHKYEELVKTILEEHVEKNGKFTQWVDGYVQHYKLHMEKIN